jgi:hypothetical protein
MHYQNHESKYNLQQFKGDTLKLMVMTNLRSLYAHYEELKQYSSAGQSGYEI